MTSLIILLLLLFKYVNSKCTDNLIISSAINITSIDSINTFITSYKHSGTIFNSKLLLLLHESIRNDISILYYLDSNSIDYRFIIPDVYIEYYRLKWIRNYLQEISHSYCNILVLSDIHTTTTYFQGDYFNELVSYVGSRSLPSSSLLSLKRDYLLFNQEGIKGGSKLKSSSILNDTSDSICFYSILNNKDNFMDYNIISSSSFSGSHRGYYSITITITLSLSLLLSQY